MPDNQETAKLAGNLYFDLTPMEANLKRFQQLTQAMGRHANWLERRMREANLSGVSSKDIATQERLLNLKYKEARIEDKMAAAKLKEQRRQESILNVKIKEQRLQKLLAQSGQEYLKTQKRELDLQNQILAKENKQLQIQRQKQQLAQRQMAMQGGAMGTTGAVGAGAAGAAGAMAVGATSKKDYTFAGALEHRLGWFASSMAFFGYGAVMAKVVRQMGDIEAGMIRINKVIDDQTVNLDEMRDELLQLGTEYGMLSEDVLRAAEIWAQAGYDQREVIELTRTSLLAMNVAELDAEESTRLLISTLKQFNLTAEESASVIDKVNQLSNDYAVTSQDLLKAVSRSGQVYKEYGVSLDQLLGYITALSESTGRTGNVIGNALRSIAVYSHRPKAIRAFEEVLGTVETAEGQFKDLDEILAELAEKWDTLTEKQRNELAQAAAGNRRRNFFISLMSHMSTAVDATTTSINSLGSAERENEMLMEAYNKKVEQLYSSLERLAVSIGEAGLLDLMKGLVDGTRGAVEEFESLPEPVKNATIALVGINAALMGVNIASRTFMGLGLGGYLIRLAARIAGVEAATLSLSGAMRILAANPVVRLITVLGALASSVALYNKYQERSVQRTSEAIQKHRDAATTAQTQADRIKELSNEYEDLKNKTDKSAAEQERMQRVEQELVELLPGLKTGYDEAGNAVHDMGNLHQEAANKVRELTAEMKEQIRVAATVAETQLPGLKEERQKAAEKKEAAQEALDYLRGGGSKTVAQAKVSEYTSLSLDPFLTEEEVAERIGNVLSEAEKERRKAEQAIESAEKAIGKYSLMEGKKRLTPLAYHGPGRGGAGGTGTGASGDAAQTTASGGTGGGTGGDTGATPSPLDFLDSYEKQIKLTDLALQRLGTRERMITQVIGDQYPTVNQARAAYINWTSQINTINQKMQQLQTENVAISKKIKRTGDSTGELTRKFKENENAILQSRQEVAQLEQKMDDFEQKMKDMRFEETMSHFQHQVNMARLNVTQQINYLETLRSEYELNAQRRWQIEEKLFGKYNQKLSDQMEKVRDAYEERSRIIEEEASSQIEAIQKQLDALNEEEKLDERENARREHEEKLQELEEERRYHELRTGQEHEEALADIEKQIEEENRRWEQQQEKWEREEKKQNLQKEIDDIKEAAEEKRQELEEYYNEAMDIMDDSTREMLASLAATDEQWYERGKTWAEQLAEGLREGNMSDIKEAVDEIRSGAGQAREEAERQEEERGSTTPPERHEPVKQPIAVISNYDRAGNTAIMKSRRLADILGESVGWDNTSKRVTIGGKSFDPVKHEDGKAYVGIRDVAERLGYSVEYDASTGISIWPRAHTGAKVVSTGFAELLKGERVLSPKVTADFDRLASVLEAVPDLPGRIEATVNGSGFDRAADRIIAAIEKKSGIQIDKLLNIENAEFEDEADVEMVGRALLRKAQNVAMGRGA